MQFLEGRGLTRALRNLVKKKGELKIAVAYWGSAGLTLLGLNPGRKNLKIVCCLAGGKSDPDLIKRFERDCCRIEATSPRKGRGKEIRIGHEVF
jgi:hypothetical protein